MSTVTTWQWWQRLPQNPIYQRERGRWGNPNPHYATLARYSPFVVIGAILLGACTGYSNPAMFVNDSALGVLYCLLCLPNFLLGALTLYGQFMTPTLTAPMISLEVINGSWDILRVTPQPVRDILAAKLLGALGRLRLLWPVLLVLSLLQGLVVTVTIWMLDTPLAFWGGLLGLATTLRPWLEILFAALLGLYLSLFVHRVSSALIGAYTLIVLFKLFNNSGLWAGIPLLLEADQTTSSVTSILGPTAVYSFCVLAILIGVNRRANRLEFV